MAEAGGAAASESEHPARRRMEGGEVALGLVTRLARSGEIARLARAAGYDFLFLDAQHAIYSLETIAHIAHAAIGCGVAPMVRVRSCRDPNVPVLLDNGVTGVVFPDVNTAEDARLAVQACRFPPIGRRSVAGPYAVFDYKAVPIGEAARRLNAATLVVCMIESREGLQNADAIASVPGVDVLLVGANDLLVDMGKPGAFGDAEIMDAVATVTAAAKRHGKFAGAGGDKDLSRQRKMIADGVRFVTTQSDMALLLDGASRLVADLRQH